MCLLYLQESQLKELKDTAASYELQREKNTNATNTSAIHNNKHSNDQSSESEKTSAMNVKDQTDHSVSDQILENPSVTVKTTDIQNKTSKASNLGALKTTNAKTCSKISNFDASVPVNEKSLSDKTASEICNKEPVIPVAKKKVQKDETSCLEDDLDMLLLLDKPKNFDENVVTKKDLSHGDSSSVREKDSKDNKKGKGECRCAMLLWQWLS